MIVRHDLWYEPARANRTLHIYLPRDYDVADERYPVMYLFDGHNLFCDEHATFGTCWGLAEFLDGWEKGLIVVGMECSHEGNSRLDEYCPYETTIMGHHIHPLGDETLRWVADAVKPYVDATFRTWAHREATGIGGSSMGGLMALYGVCRHNAVFSKAACLSPALHTVMDQVMAEVEGATLDPDTRVYLSCGTREAGRTPKGGNPLRDSIGAKNLHAVADALGARNANAYAYVQPGGKHNEASWRKQNERYLSYLWLDRRLPRDNETN